MVFLDQSEKQNVWQRKRLLLPLQFENEANPLVHEKTTGPEIHQAFGVNGLDAFVAGIGTGGTITGAGRELKRVSENRINRGRTSRICYFRRERSGTSQIQGIGTGFVPKTLDTSVYDKVLSISGDEAMETAREVGRKKGF